MLNTQTKQREDASAVVSREEMMRQWEMAGQNRQLLIHRMGHPPRAWVKTFGCQGNVADSEKIMGMLIDMGCEPALDEKQADIILYNTCAIRENAQVLSRKSVREIFGGGVAQVHGDGFRPSGGHHLRHRFGTTGGTENDLIDRHRLRSFPCAWNSKTF